MACTVCQFWGEVKVWPWLYHTSAIRRRGDSHSHKMTLHRVSCEYQTLCKITACSFKVCSSVGSKYSWVENMLDPGPLLKMYSAPLCLQFVVSALLCHFHYASKLGFHDLASFVVVCFSSSNLMNVHIWDIRNRPQAFSPTLCSWNLPEWPWTAHLTSGFSLQPDRVITIGRGFPAWTKSLQLWQVISSLLHFTKSF